MPRGNTATVNIVEFKSQWDLHVPIRQLCDQFTVSRDQITRLKFVWNLAPRHDRKLRKKPERLPPPSPAEIAASESSLRLAPMIAARVTCVTISWTEAMWAERQVTKPTAFNLTRINLTDEARDEMESWDD